MSNMTLFLDFNKIVDEQKIREAVEQYLNKGKLNNETIYPIIGVMVSTDQGFFFVKLNPMSEPDVIPINEEITPIYIGG